ncbi:hypothetical protein GGD68_007054 [Paraburkholderia fungorum]|uniref:hypothetical protein n=1 Tax=Paraburkholderia fungorum TaxID=134537 RepID=UPI0016095512|nr:hypothetical protein [Paraburkholderia fungorum]MBB4518248.1 hypothetical protein [Paraburkholderia fungorum]
MDVGWFLKQRIGFIRQLYRDSTAPVVERMRLIEAEEPPFEPPYSEDGEPAFLTEWIEGSDSVQVLGHTCVSILAGALHAYFETWERSAGIEIDPKVRKGLPGRSVETPPLMVAQIPPPCAAGLMVLFSWFSISAQAFQRLP